MQLPNLTNGVIQLICRTKCSLKALLQKDTRNNKEMKRENEASNMSDLRATFPRRPMTYLRVMMNWVIMMARKRKQNSVHTLTSYVRRNSKIYVSATPRPRWSPFTRVRIQFTRQTERRELVSWPISLCRREVSKRVLIHS